MSFFFDNDWVIEVNSCSPVDQLDIEYLLLPAYGFLIKQTEPEINSTFAVYTPG